VLRKDCPAIPVIVDSVNNTYACVRTLSAPTDTLFCQFYNAEGWTPETFIKDNATLNYVEYYDLVVDPWQLTNAVAGL
jgi:hypothetical protein